MCFILYVVCHIFYFILFPFFLVILYNTSLHSGRATNDIDDFNFILGHSGVISAIQRGAQVQTIYKNNHKHNVLHLKHW